MKRLILLIITVIAANSINAQTPHEHPDHLRGNNSNDQYLALPFYNEACELYSNGEIERAKQSLYEAINTSFALTEAQLFLAKIFYDQNIMDSAFLYFNSGIDFATHQEPHHYFFMAETGLMMEQYHTVKHNLKHFKKYYGKVAEGKYEAEFPFTVDDYERLSESMEIIFNYDYWVPKANLIDTLKRTSGKLCVDGKNIIDYGKSKRLLSRKAFKKRKTYQLFKSEIQDLHLSKSGKLAFYSRKKDGEYDLFWRKLEGKKWGPEMSLSDQINTNSWEGQPFFDETRSLLYFSSNRTGNKDLFVAKINLNNNTLDTLEALWKINTPKDDEYPFWNNGTFYFSSKGHPGFGGSDLMYTPNYSIVNDVVQPSNAYNMGKPYNTGRDDGRLIMTQEGIQCIKRKNFKGEEVDVLLVPTPQKNTFDFDIKIKSMAKTEAP